jgi:hypothetical protein
MRRGLRPVRNGIVSDAEKAITAVTQAAGVSSRSWVIAPISAIVGSRLARDRGADSIAATTLQV